MTVNELRKLLEGLPGKSGVYIEVWQDGVLVEDASFSIDEIILPANLGEVILRSVD